MSSLSDALEAMDKATPGPWVAKLCLGGSYVIDNTLPENKGLVRNIAEVSGHLSTPKDAKVIAAAPDALAWIKEALPWLEIRADEIRYELDIQETLIGPKLSDACIETMKSDIARLDALIARAKE